MMNSGKQDQRNRLAERKEEEIDKKNVNGANKHTEKWNGVSEEGYRKCWVRLPHLSHFIISKSFTVIPDLVFCGVTYPSSWCHCYHSCLCVVHYGINFCPTVWEISPQGFPRPGVLMVVWPCRLTVSGLIPDSSCPHTEASLGNMLNPKLPFMLSCEL